jgi:hypothetical protein
MISIRRLNDVERRGTLTYLTEASVERTEGWFTLSPDCETVWVRPVRGRKSVPLCPVLDVIYFEAES